MLNPNYTVVGIARAFNANSTYGWYWTNNFGLATDPGPPVPTPPGNTPIVTPPPSITPTPDPNQGSPIISVNGCGQSSIGASDDGSSAQVPLGFTINFFGQSYSALYVNNNGNVTFENFLSTFTPFGLQGTSTAIIAPFFADVDTAGPGSGVTTFGQVTFEGRPAFCVNWINVGYYNDHTDKKNSFQLLLVQRTDAGVGDFDIIMNFDKIQWETGDLSGGTGGLGGNSARMGYSNGSDVSFEYPGSAQNGALLDSSPTGLSRNSRDSLQEGRYIFPVRNGAPPTGGTISGKVYKNSVAPANVVTGATVEVCGASCTTTGTNAAGEFLFTNNAPGEKNFRVNPPAGSGLNQGMFGPFVLQAGESMTDLEFVLLPEQLPPPDTTITSRQTSGGTPVVNWHDDLTLRSAGCTGGTASYTLTHEGATLRSGPLAENPAGNYTAVVPSLHPAHGPADVHVQINCPGGGQQTKDFGIYIDPSGNVRTVEGDPIVGARVTLYRSDTPGGPFVIVPNQSAIMSPANRTNPDYTDGEGHFGWDVIAGYYKVRAEKPDCTSPTNPSQAYSETAVLAIPPPVTDLDIRLDCPRQHFAQGDVDCSGAVQPLDALLVALFSSGQPVAEVAECPQMGSVTAATGLAYVFGDVDCDEDIDGVDAMLILRGVAGAPAVALPQGCREVGH
jgi:hypothetical protein